MLHHCAPRTIIRTGERSAPHDLEAVTNCQHDVAWCQPPTQPFATSSNSTLCRSLLNRRQSLLYFDLVSGEARTSDGIGGKVGYAVSDLISPFKGNNSCDQLSPHTSHNHLCRLIGVHLCRIDSHFRILRCFVGVLQPRDGG